jgi:hypothetical protein
MRFHRASSAAPPLLLCAHWAWASTQGVETAEAVPRHCAVQVQATRIGETVPLYVPAVPPRCFGSFTEALNAATGGSVNLPSTVSPADAMRALLAAEIPVPAPDPVPMPVPAPNGRQVIGIEWEHANYYGSSSIYWSEAADCRTSSFEVAQVADAWNDRISSAQAYSYCNHSAHFEHADFTGAQVDCGTDCAYIGHAMNDRTTSIRWSR